MDDAGCVGDLRARCPRHLAKALLRFIYLPERNAPILMIRTSVTVVSYVPARWRIKSVVLLGKPT
jgi:hypothetical protein